MGRELIRLTVEDSRLTLTAAVDRVEGPPHPLADFVPGVDGAVLLDGDLPSAAAAADVVVDFSRADAVGAVARACLGAKTALVTGTTALDDDARRALEELAAEVPVVAAPNFSQGVTLLFHLAAEASRRLGAAFDAEIVEMHHRHKLDAPSGTAARLAEVVAEAKGIDRATGLVYGRSGMVGARPDAEVGVMALRGGDVVGEHTLYLAGEGERLELTHRATSRAVFAAGALRAAAWVVSQRPGHYDMRDVMGLGA